MTYADQNNLADTVSLQKHGDYDISNNCSLIDIAQSQNYLEEIVFYYID